MVSSSSWARKLPLQPWRRFVRFLFKVSPTTVVWAIALKRSWWLKEKHRRSPQNTKDTVVINHPIGRMQAKPTDHHIMYHINMIKIKCVQLEISFQQRFLSHLLVLRWILLLSRLAMETHQGIPLSHPGIILLAANLLYFYRSLFLLNSITTFLIRILHRQRSKWRIPNDLYRTLLPLVILFLLCNQWRRTICLSCIYLLSNIPTTHPTRWWLINSPFLCRWTLHLVLMYRSTT